MPAYFSKQKLPLGVSHIEGKRTCVLHQPLEDEPDEKCSICLNSLRYGCHLDLPCSHAFCRQCLSEYAVKLVRSDPWASIPCPLCRTNCRQTLQIDPPILMAADFEGRCFCETCQGNFTGLLHGRIMIAIRDIYQNNHQVLWSSSLRLEQHALKEVLSTQSTGLLSIFVRLKPQRGLIMKGLKSLSALGISVVTRPALDYK